MESQDVYSDYAHFIMSLDFNYMCFKPNQYDTENREIILRYYDGRIAVQRTNYASIASYNRVNKHYVIHKDSVKKVLAYGGFDAKHAIDKLMEELLTNKSVSFSSDNK